MPHSRQWCEPPCVLPFGHAMDCWDGDTVVDQVPLGHAGTEALGEQADRPGES